jgi:hypothetical protein
MSGGEIGCPIQGLPDAVEFAIWCPSVADSGFAKVTVRSPTETELDAYRKQVKNEESNSCVPDVKILPSSTLPLQRTAVLHRTLHSVFKRAVTNFTPFGHDNQSTRKTSEV